MNKRRVVVTTEVSLQGMDDVGCFSKDVISSYKMKLWPEDTTELQKKIAIKRLLIEMSNKLRELYNMA